MYSMRVLALLALLVGSTHCFSWDIVVGEDKQLDFYNNGTLTHTEDIPSANYINSVTYDPVHYRVLFADHEYNDPNVSISSFDLTTRKIQPLVTRASASNIPLPAVSYARVAYDPVTQLLFWKQYMSIYSFSLNPASSNKADDGNLLVTLDQFCWDIAVDSCGGYIYWITNKIERARFDGSERSVLIEDRVDVRGSLAIDQQTQKLYWTEIKPVKYRDYRLSIECADFNGKNRKAFYTFARKAVYGYSLAVSKDFIYWKKHSEVGIWQLPKIPSQHVEGKLFSMSSSDTPTLQRIAANYKIQEQIQGTKTCEALQRLIPSFSICQNYCFQGDCSVSAEGKPSCSCKAGYSGEKCEVNACHKYCLNKGVCSLNEENEAVCECTADYEGLRCDVATTYTGVHAENTTPQLLQDLRKEVRQVINEELKRMLQFFSDKIDKYQA